MQQPNAESAERARRTQKKFDPEENQVSQEVIGAAVQVQRVLGVGLLESAYSAAFGIELAHRGLRYEKEVPIEGSYREVPLGVLYRADFVVESTVLVELKAVEAVSHAHRAQLLSYLRLSGLQIGLLINFHAAPLVKDLHRIVNRF